MDILHYEYDKTLPFNLLNSNATKKGEFKTFERVAFPYYVFEYVLTGEGTVIIDNRIKFKAKQNDVYILPKYYSHKFYPDNRKPWQKIFFIIDGIFAEQCIQNYNLKQKYLFHNSNIKEYFYEMRNIFLSVNPRLNHIAAHIFLDIIQKLYDHALSSEKHISRDVAAIKDIIDNNLNENLDLNKICSRIRWSKSYMIRKFKEETGRTPYDYMLIKKIELAKKILTLTDFSIKEIAEKLKFADQYYFSGIFKKKVGVSPKKFRMNF
jgi:AraC-like DNA-binding protein